MSSTLLLPPREQLCNRSCSNKHTLEHTIKFFRSSSFTGPGKPEPRCQCRHSNLKVGLRGSESNLKVPWQSLHSACHERSEAAARERERERERESRRALLGKRDRVLFIGTQFSILYTSMYSPAGAAIRLTTVHNGGSRAAPAARTPHKRDHHGGIAEVFRQCVLSVYF